MPIASGCQEIRPSRYNRGIVRLFFLRHGAAVDAEVWKGGDYDRPLTTDGQARVAREAKALSKLGLDVDVMITSPLERAKETAVIVADALKIRDRMVEDERLGSDFCVERLSEMLQEHVDAKTIMLVGHEPTMSETIGSLVGGARIDLKKGGLACVDIPERASLSGDLLWLVPPKILAG